MKITLRSSVNGEMEVIQGHFDANLFRYLLPPGAQLIEFGGSRKGDRVHLNLPIVGEWISEITEDKATDDIFYFIDVGKKLPFPIKKWQHKHILRRNGKKTIIEDHMKFSTGTMVSDILFYPFLYFSFLPRTWQYGRYFRPLE